MEIAAKIIIALCIPILIFGISMVIRDWLIWFNIIKSPKYILPKPTRLLAYTKQEPGRVNNVMFAYKYAKPKYLQNNYGLFRIPHLDEPIKDYKKRLKAWQKQQ